MLARREFVGSAATVLLLGGLRTMEELPAGTELYGVIGEMRAVPGKRDELIGYLLAGTGAMPGNLAYLVAKDAANPDSIWITEVWRDRASHDASLTLPAVRDAIASARPIIAGFGTRVETLPVSA